MLRWKSASAVFQGGTAQVLALKGKRVRARVALQGIPVNVLEGNPPQTVDVPLGSLGLIANPSHADILIAMPKALGMAVTTIEALTRSGAITVIRINWPTFREQFEVEV
jgi:citrate lyase alpha subunit